MMILKHAVIRACIFPSSRYFAQERFCTFSSFFALCSRLQHLLSHILDTSHANDRRGWRRTEEQYESHAHAHVCRHHDSHSLSLSLSHSHHRLCFSHEKVMIFLANATQPSLSLSLSPSPSFRATGKKIATSNFNVVDPLR